MRPESDIPGLLWDALAFSRNAQIAVGNTPLESYLEGGPVAWATERQMELIGEALNKLRRAHPDVAERVPHVERIIGMRNVLAHGYLIINDRVVWQAATQAVPELIPILEKILDEFGAESDLSAPQ